jgi:hypothetical protein
MDFDFTKMTAYDKSFYGVVPGNAAYPIGRVCLPVMFGKEDNFRMEYLTFEVADFRSSYHAILARPMLDKCMTIPHHTYVIKKMPTSNGILPIYGDLIISFKCDNDTVNLATTSAYRAAATVMVAQAAKIDQTTLEVPEQKCTTTALEASPAVKKVCLSVPMQPRKSPSGPTLTPNRNSHSLVSSGTMLTSSHGVHPTCLVSPGSWLNTPLK